MEGNGGFGYQHLERNPRLLRPSPPLTAIERFLWSTPSDISQNQGMNNRETVVSGTGFPDFWFSFGASDHGYAVDGLSANVESSLSRMLETNHKMEFREKNIGGIRKRVKGGSSSSSTLIKGRWTDEEDRFLVRLVKQYGEKKWAQIAEKLPGRVGKQCRERWHNHLRPDIKKDSWSEEEERLLVEAHEKIGNRWAEIAKRIPGRTENVIKNHWNATKRRQNSKRKSKKTLVQGGKTCPSILQDYIRSKIIKDISPTTTTTTPPNQSSTSTTTYDDDDDELLFMQKLFETNYKQPCEGGTMVSSIEGEMFQNHLSLLDDSLELYGNNIGDDHSFIQMDECDFPTFSTPITNMFIHENLLNKETNTTHLYSDFYLSDLLNEATSSTSIGNYYHCENPNADLLTDQVSSSSGKKEMDLIEMISSSQFSWCSNSSF